MGVNCLNLEVVFDHGGQKENYFRIHIDLPFTPNELQEINTLLADKKNDSALEKLLTKYPQHKEIINAALRAAAPC